MNTDATVAVAYSGGRDSTALLHATVAAAAPLGIQVVALHVHHGLSAHADAWLRHCRAQVRGWRRRHPGLSLAVERLTDRPAAGDSIEAWARRARYAALRRMALAAGADSVLLAHHRRDQAETWLLQALRGAGIAGQAAMPRQVYRDGILWCRPWLGRPREAVQAYLRRHRLGYIDDDSNGDARYARNRLRLQVWPALSAAFPQAEASLADAARWAQQAQEALQELAALDLAAVADAPGLRLTPWRGLSEARRALVLRVWLQQQTGQPAPASLVLRLIDEWPEARSARWPIPGGVLKTHRGCLAWSPLKTVAPGPADETVQSLLTIHRAGTYPLAGWGGSLRVTRVQEGGVPMAWLGQVSLKHREGGERFQAGPGRPPRSLKKQYQAAAVPAWLRAGPLVYSGGQLVFVPGLGIDARVTGLPGQPQALLGWEPDDPVRSV